MLEVGDDPGQVGGEALQHALVVMVVKDVQFAARIGDLRIRSVRILHLDDVDNFSGKFAHAALQPCNPALGGPCSEIGFDI